MPPPPDFDYYKELQLDRIAPAEDIKNSYRRLALIHHPDKNPENRVAATAAFQKIQTAYETLSDPRARAIYDARSSRSTTLLSSGRSPFDSEDDNDDDDEDADFDDDFDAEKTFADFMRGQFGRGGPPGYSSQGYSGFGPFFHNGNFGFYSHRMDPEEMRKRAEEREKAKEASRKRMANEIRQRMEREEALAKARKEAKMAEEKQRMTEKEGREMAERAKNEKIWIAEQAITQEEKQRLCLHSEVWSEKFPKKVKCEACGQKRGIVGYRCPHCALLACQVCLNKFNEARKAP
ncbi:DnaJ domain containing protein [Hyaloscypha variabilis]